MFRESRGGLGTGLEEPPSPTFPTSPPKPLAQKTSSGVRKKIDKVSVTLKVKRLLVSLNQNVIKENQYK